MRTVSFVGVGSALFALFGFACSDSAGSSAPAPGGAVTQALACGLARVPAKLEVGEGARASIAFDDLAPDATVEVVRQDGEPLDVIEQSDKAVKLRAPYGGARTVDVAVRAGCSKGKSEVKVTLNVRAMKWTQLASWSWKPGTTDVPAGREYGAMWLDPSNDDRLLVFGGYHYYPKQFTPANDLWEYSLSSAAWRAVAVTDAPARPGGRVTPIPGGTDVLFFGGAISEADGSLLTPSETYRIGTDGDAARIVKVDTKGETLGSYTGSLVYDAPRNRFVSACGTSSDVGPNCDTYTFSFEGQGGGRWEKLAVVGDKPEGRAGFHYAYDPEGERLVIFGGDSGMGRTASIEEETWALELGQSPARWVKILGPQEPKIGRRNGAWVYDSIEHRLLVWGGTANGRTTMPGLDVLHLDRGKEGWKHVEVATDVPKRSSAAAVFDAKKNRMVAGFGNETIAKTDLWSLEL